MTVVKYFVILLHRETILQQQEGLTWFSLIRNYTLWEVIPYDKRVDDKEAQKLEKYLDLARELKKVWNMKVTIASLVVWTLGTRAKASKRRLKTIRIETKISDLQKTVLIHASRILGKVLEVWGALFTPYLKNKTCPLVEINMRLFNNNNDNNNNNCCDAILKSVNKPKFELYITVNTNLLSLYWF